MRIRARWAGLAFLAFPACGPPPQAVPTLPPGIAPELKVDENDPPQAKGEVGATSDSATPVTNSAESATPPPVKPISESTLPSGLKVAILQEGTGAVAAKGLAVDVQYTGWVEGGRIFDSTSQKKALFQFVLGSGDALKGLEEGIAGMKVGERRRLTVPPALGYGTAGQPTMRVPADATLIYDVALVGVTVPGDIPATSAAQEPETAPPVKPISESTLPSGLKIEILQEGAGEVARKGQSAAVHYTGWVLRGRKFDSSRDRGNPFTFTIGARQVIVGWDEGAEGMKVGERRRLTIPPAIAYGSQGRAKIPPDSTLVFDIELVGLNGGPKEAEAPKPAGAPKPEESPKPAEAPKAADAPKPEEAKAAP